MQRGGVLGPRQAIVPRAACTYHRLPLPGVNRNRAAALALAVQRVSPQSTALHASVWQGDVAHVWVLDECASADVGVAEALVAESSLIAPLTGADGARLVGLARGAEGQVWRGGELVASRWWPAAPDGPAWGRFLRAASLPVDYRVPAIEPAVLQREPWGTPAGALPWAPAQLEAGFWRVVALCVGFGVGTPLLAGLLWQAATFQMARDLDAVRAASAPLIEARERAERYRGRAEALLVLTSGPRDYLLLADLRERLPDGDRLTGWLRDGDRLRAEVIAASRDPRVYVQAFAGHQALASVVANPADGGRMQLEFELLAMEPAP